MQKNIPSSERASTAAAGAVMLARGLQLALRQDQEREPMAGLLTGLGGTALLVRAATGYCPLYHRLQTGPQASMLTGQEPAAEVSVIVNKPRDEVYRYFQTLNANPGPLGAGSATLSAVVAGQNWQIDLEPLATGTATLVKVTARHAPDGSVLMSLLHTAAGTPVKKAAATALRNMKATIETGEVATIVGQPEGQRSLFGKALGPVMDAARTILDEFATAPMRRPFASVPPPPRSNAAAAALEARL